MKPIDIDDVVKYVEDHIETFHEKRISSLDNLSLNKILRRKNPYLFKAKHIQTAGRLIEGIVDAHISSNEETLFGDWLEELAIFVNGKVYGGYKSGISGIDLEFDNDNTRYIVSIKSGPNWGNSGQISNMRSNFKTAQRTLRTGNAKLNIVCVNGCCYGRDNNPDKGDYFKYCGQRFWEFISGDKNFYTEIIKPLGRKAKKRKSKFEKTRTKRVNAFTLEFVKTFCNGDGDIDWKKLVEFNSSISTSSKNNTEKEK